MTNEQRQFHTRMNTEIVSALLNLRHEFDVTPQDVRPDAVEWQILQSTLKTLLLSAYARNHSWIA